MLPQVKIPSPRSPRMSFYPALQSNRAVIASFYSTPTSTILFNGNAVADGNAVQDIFVNQMPPTHYEVQSFDCQIINKSYPTPTPSGVKLPNQITTKDISILVIVSGFVRFGESRDLPQRGFSETFVLVPYSSADGPKGKRKQRDWLIQTQNFRLVV
ncbi:nuclear transport factor 2 domain protein [Aspergillus ochraceoroseus]|uniref:Nuclear transport factor 2 domain protein n=1 Tax=Aspergillus ochraceoroseus TaxID=138278 RepID=A0A0F8USW7_9EURO|nr:nuclear transport factor 2 domain protein [Aspergillus ochraceoroseus]